MAGIRKQLATKASGKNSTHSGTVTLRKKNPTPLLAGGSLRSFELCVFGIVLSVRGTLDEANGVALACGQVAVMNVPLAALEVREGGFDKPKKAGMCGSTSSRKGCLQDRAVSPDTACRLLQTCHLGHHSRSPVAHTDHWLSLAAVWRPVGQVDGPVVGHVDPVMAPRVLLLAVGLGLVASISDALKQRTIPLIVLDDIPYR